MIILNNPAKLHTKNEDIAFVQTHQKIAAFRCSIVDSSNDMELANGN